jgi:hypothetical protein
VNNKIPVLLISVFILSCGTSSQEDTATAKQENPPEKITNPIQGTWKLLTGTLIEKGDTTVTDYTKDQSFIKIINDSYFAFLLHDLTKGKQPKPVFTAGGGMYYLKDSLYTEHLQYCNDRQWEGNDFTFVVTIKNDTLVQRGVEKVKAANVDRVNIEKYVRVKN